MAPKIEQIETVRFAMPLEFGGKQYMSFRPCEHGSAEYVPTLNAVQLIDKRGNICIVFPPNIAYLKLEKPVENNRKNTTKIHSTSDIQRDTQDSVIF